MEEYNESLDITFRGLGEWYKKLFEKLGWILLSLGRRDTDKLLWYQRSLYRFMDKAENKLAQTVSVDKQNDIKIMLNNIYTLKLFVDHLVDEHLDGEIMKSKQKIKLDSIKPKRMTSKGLFNWYESIFEKVGWMILSLRRKDAEKLEWFQEGLRKFLKSSLDKIDRTQSYDKQEDLSIMIQNVASLYYFMEHILDEHLYNPSTIFDL